jgi:hypothetical protein
VSNKGRCVLSGFNVVTIGLIFAIIYFNIRTLGVAFMLEGVVRREVECSNYMPLEISRDRNYRVVLHAHET